MTVLFKRSLFLCLAMWCALVASLGLMIYVRSHKVISRLEDVDYAAAKSTFHEDLRLPPEVTHIHAYMAVGGLQDLELYYCCSVHPSQVEAAVDEVVAIDKAQSHGSPAYHRCVYPNPDVETPSARKEGLAWWLAPHIARGVYHGASESYAIRVWGDLDTGIIYCYVND